MTSRRMRQQRADVIRNKREACGPDESEGDGSELDTGIDAEARAAYEKRYPSGTPWPLLNETTQEMWLRHIFVSKWPKAGEPQP